MSAGRYLNILHKTVIYFSDASGLRSHVSHDKKFKHIHVTQNWMHKKYAFANWMMRWAMEKGCAREKKRKKADNNNDALDVFCPIWNNKHMDDLVNYYGTDEKKKERKNIMHEGKYYYQTLYSIPQKFFFLLIFSRNCAFACERHWMAGYEWWSYPANFDMNEWKKIVNKWRVMNIHSIFICAHSPVSQLFPVSFRLTLFFGSSRWTTRHVTSKFVVLWAKNTEKNEFILTLWWNERK